LLTEKGIDLAPMIMEIVLWSNTHVRAYNLGMNEYETQSIDKTEVIKSIQEEYRGFLKGVIG
jgi:DNA-binding HxlR family transcriptional regulator